MTQSTAVTVRGVEEVELRKADRLSNVQRLGNILAASGYFSDAREMAQAAVKVMAGEEIGVPPIAAMMGINIIKGKVAMGAHLIASRVRAHGYDFRVKQLDGAGCVLDFLSKPDANTGKRTVLGASSFTEEDAKLAGVYSDMYKKYARNMYYARAVSNGARWYTPDVLSGMPVYVPEELGARVDGEGDIIHEEQRPTPEAVAAHKIAEMKAGKSYAEISTPDPRVDPPAPKRPWRTFKGMVETFEELKKRLGPYTNIYYQCLEKQGVKHANELKSTDIATAAYLDVLSKVEEYEAMCQLQVEEPAEDPMQEALGL